MNDRQGKRQKTYEEALNEVKAEVQKEKEQKQYELRKNDALFSVHGERYTLGEFIEEFKELRQDLQTQFASFDAKKTLVDQLITKQLLLEESEDDVVTDDSKEIEELKSRYLMQVLHKEEIDERMGEISDEEAKKFYEEKKSYLVEPARVKFSLIRINQGASDAEKTRARQRIDEVWQKLKSGVDFASLARDNSDDPTASMGGELEEWIYDEDHIDPAAKKNIFGLKVNEISDVFELAGGYYIIKLRQKEDKKQKPYEEVSALLKQSLMEEKHYKMMTDLQDELFKKEKFTIYESSLNSMLGEEKKNNQL